ncbi:MAG: hypothetical protein Q7R43_01850, partial [Candidatus Daviesbacteria bacterium]|nr:hypothetical protein [Candidatus Daviesbacteria bacterium]
MMKTIRRFGLLIPLLVMVLNPWWWTIFQRNLIVGVLIFALSLVVYIYFWQIKSEKLFLVLLALTIILFIISIREAFDESIFRLSSLDIQQINRRHEFYANSLGKIYTNRFSLAYFKEFNPPLYKLQSNFFGNLDPNLYFFNSHPRERLGVEEFNKYFPIFLPFFLVGFFYLIYRPLYKIIIYFVAISLISVIISPKYNLGPILFFPIINFMITVGVILASKYLASRF